VLQPDIALTFQNFWQCQKQLSHTSSLWDSFVRGDHDVSRHLASNDYSPDFGEFFLFFVASVGNRLARFQTRLCGRT